MARKAVILFTLFALCAASLFAVQPLDGTKWKLTGWTLSSLDPKDFAITLAFSGGKISGSGGVNSYSGPCEVNPDGSFIAGEISSTLMAGSEPAMRAEAAFFKLLAEVKSYKISGDRLTLYDGKGNESLIFERVKE